MKGDFTHKQVVNISILCEVNIWPFTVGKDFTLGCSLFGAVNLTTSIDPEN